MTEQQKQAVEERCTSEYGTDQYLWAQQRDGFRVGAQEVINNPSKYGLQPINEWVSVKDRLPLTWESGKWDGRRSDEVLIRKINNRYVIGRLYQGILDGSVFTEWSEGKEEWILELEEVTHWLQLPDVEPK